MNTTKTARELTDEAVLYQKGMIAGIQNTAQECYLECIAVECGEGECAKAIATKYPSVSRVEEEVCH